VGAGTEIQEPWNTLTSKGVKMKYFLACLFIGCLISPAWSVERDMTLEEFVQKLEKAEPWTQEKVEAQLGVKFTYTTSTGVVTRYVAYEPLPSVKDLAIQAISLSVSAATNKALHLSVSLDSELSCLTQKQIEKLFPGGYLEHKSVQGGLIYVHKRSWGILEFDFDFWRVEKHCLEHIFINTNNTLK
jgi:transcriptional regulator with XRE-family HTH domain